MGPFRQIAGDKAGPAALGILAPPGHRTVLILRPRALDCDLVLLLDSGGNTFRKLTRDQAAAAARAVLRALEDWAAGGLGSIEPVAQPDGTFQLRAAVAAYAFLVCPRLAGQPYQPLVCLNLDTACQTARALRHALCPPAGVEREVYFNAVYFSR